MSKLKMFGVLVSTGFLCVACGFLFEPKLGMTVDEYKSKCISANLTQAVLVGAKEDTETYYCDYTTIHSIFRNGILVEVKQVPLPQNTIGIDVKK